MTGGRIRGRQLIDKGFVRLMDFIYQGFRHWDIWIRLMTLPVRLVHPIKWKSGPGAVTIQE